MITINDYDKQVYEEIRDFLPNHIIDCHTHVYKEEFLTHEKLDGVQDWVSKVCVDCTMEALIDLYTKFFPGKTVTPVIFGFPAGSDYRMGNPYILEQGRKHGFPQLFNSHPNMPCEEIEAALDAGFSGLKPYLNNAPNYVPSNEIRIFDFLPHEHLAVVNRRKAAVMLHIPRPKRIKDPVNIAQILEIEQKYPDAQIILAHIGRAYAPEDFGDAFELLSKTEHVMFDFSANTLDEAIKRALDTVGPNRMLFGSDIPIVIMRMKRIVESGTYINVVPPGLYGDLQGVPHLREAPADEKLTFFMYEIIKAAKRALAGYSSCDVESVFCNNAKRVFKM